MQRFKNRLSNVRSHSSSEIERKSTRSSSNLSSSSASLSASSSPGRSTESESDSSDSSDDESSGPPVELTHDDFFMATSRAAGLATSSAGKMTVAASPTIRRNFLGSVVKTVQEAEYRGSTVRVEEVQTQTVIARRLHVFLNNRAFRAERKAFHYSVGRIDLAVQMKSKSSGASFKSKLSKTSDVAKDFVKSKLSNESFIKPRYDGKGEVFLEMTWSYLYLLQLQLGDVIYVESGHWHACDDNVTVDLSVETNVITGLLGGGFVSTKLVGEGWICIKLPVPISEIHRVYLDNSKVRISEGNIVLLQRGHGIKHKVKKATKSVVAMAVRSFLFGPCSSFFSFFLCLSHSFSSCFLCSSKTTGEGIVQSFEGTGEVWYVQPCDFPPSVSCSNLR